MPNRSVVRPLSGVFAALIIAVVLVLHGLSAAAQAKKQESKSGVTAGIVPGTSAGTSIEEERLKILKADLQLQIDQLKKLKQEVEEQRKAADGKKQEQLVKVVKMYEAMPPEEAARALEKLDDDTAVQILTTLKARSAGKVLAQIDPARAATLSKKALLKSK